MSYTVALIGWRGASASQIDAAVARFRGLLDAELGAKLADVYRAWLNASSQTHDTPRDAWPPEARDAIARWERPFSKASAQALESLPGKGPGAWFDVQLDAWP